MREKKEKERIICTVGFPSKLQVQLQIQVCIFLENNFLLYNINMSIVRFESGKKATFWNPPPPSGDLVG